MRETLSTIGLGALVCLPCLLVAGGIGIAAFGGALVAFATNPGVQAAGALALLGAVALGTIWYARLRTRTCSTCGLRERRHQAHATGRHAPRADS